MEVLSSSNELNASQESQLVIVDDGQGQFGPLSHTRASFDMLTGGCTNRVRILRQLKCQNAVIQNAVIQDAVTWAPDFQHAIDMNGVSPSLIVNGSWAASDLTEVEAVRGLAINEGYLDQAGRVVAVFVKPLETSETLKHILAKPKATTIDWQTWQGSPLPTRPWHWLDQLEANLQHDLASVHSDSLLDPTAELHPTAVLDETRGPVYVGPNAKIRPYAVIEGPAWISDRAIINPHAHIRPNTVVGHDCVIGGEVNASVIYPYTSKAHDGYLGNAIVGSWCNLGAGTTVSNLKNTFSEVRMQLAANQPPEPTGRLKLGPILGDAVRTAIGSRLMTGSCIGTGSMIAVSSYAPKYVDAFRFLTDQADAPHDWSAFESMLRQMMAFREVELEASYLNRLQMVHAEAIRQMA